MDGKAVIALLLSLILFSYFYEVTELLVSKSELLWPKFIWVTKGKPRCFIGGEYL